MNIDHIPAWSVVAFGITGNLYGCRCSITEFVIHAKHFKIRTSIYLIEIQQIIRVDCFFCFVDVNDPELQGYRLP